MYSYKLSIEAEEDITRIFEYGFYKFGMVQANKYYDMLFDCFHKIASNPFLFPTADHIKIGYRYCVCGVDTIYYTVHQDKVEIIAVIGRQNFLGGVMEKL